MCIEKEFLALESGLDYDEYCSDKDLDLRDCTNCVNNFYGYWYGFEDKQNYCLKVSCFIFRPILPFYCSSFELIEKKQITSVKEN